MNYQDVRKARDQAEYTLNNADKVVREAVSLIKGRLKSSRVSWLALNELKRELRNYNMHTGSWKE
jgi:hypothetical protein